MQATSCLRRMRSAVEEVVAEQNRQWTEKSAVTMADEERLQAVISLASNFAAEMTSWSQHAH